MLLFQPPLGSGDFRAGLDAFDFGCAALASAAALVGCSSGRWIADRRDEPAGALAKLGWLFPFLSTFLSFVFLSALPGEFDGERSP